MHGNSQFQKPSHLRWTWESLGGQFRDEVDHIIFSRRFCLIDVAVVPKLYTESEHSHPHARSCFSVRGKRARLCLGNMPQDLHQLGPLRFPCV
ncbi:unnamed protein product [Haemonchus placei]|uniref:Uncharacterized protein n=1 Tax=Haemonchus placei TaxID=6290 RepID=A0A0N4X4S8_HAEPC|nr:unnamed protein product [Haemonchus placei]